MIARLQNLRPEAQGVVYALICHLIWGGMAAYMNLIKYVNPFEIVVHRALWSLPIGIVFAGALGYFPKIWDLLRNKRMLATIAFTSMLMFFNWTLYIWAITSGHALDGSFGYFINPLMNVAVGYIFLGERFTKPQGIAIALAIVAVGIAWWGTGVFPIIGLGLAASFCLYGYIRKTIPAGAVEAFVVEVAISLVPLSIVNFWLMGQGKLLFGSNAHTTLLLIGCGGVTAAALLAYSASIRLMRYSTAGLLQYLSPSLVFLTAVFWLGEPLNQWRLAGFALIWLALVIYSVAAFRDERLKVSAG